MNLFFHIIVLLTLLEKVYSCVTIHVTSKTFGKIEFSQLPANKNPSFNGRPIYYSQNHELYIYHVVEDDEFGRWIMSISLEDHDKAIAFVDSWAITPYLIYQVGASPWTVYSANEWITEPAFDVKCEKDETLYFDPGLHSAHQLAGFYVLRHHDEDQFGPRPIYSLINDHHPVGEHIFLHWYDGFWVIGDEAGKDQSLAHIKSDAWSPREISKSSEWKFVKMNKEDGTHQWLVGEIPTQMISVQPGVVDIYATLREHKSLKFLPGHQQHYELRNNVIMPVMGFGTGGLHPQKTQSIIKMALNSGYRLLDLAREYNNEHVVAQVFDELRHIHESTVRRSDIFISTKVSFNYILAAFLYIINICTQYTIHICTRSCFYYAY